MRTMNRLLLMVGCCALAAGCAEETTDTKEIVDNLLQAGFRADDIAIVNESVYVGGDAQVTLTASREMIRTEASSKEQYRTTNLVSRSLRKVCINASTFTGIFSIALDFAVQNYNQLPLTFRMARTPANGCDATINAHIEGGLDGGHAGFPANGLPFPDIFIGNLLANRPVNTIAHVITHELGHTIGFRHSDFFNRSISCNSGGAESTADGAIHIPGTPTGATVGGSLMNACFRAIELGKLTIDDISALSVLYGVTPPPVDFNVTFQANTNKLWTTGLLGTGDVGLGLMPGTSPSIAALSGGGHQIAFQANTGKLWTTGPLGTGDLGLGMLAGTSPSITALSTGGYQIAFQANDTKLWTTGATGTGDLGLGMLAGTSPSITALSTGGYQIAFQANNGKLWITGAAGTGDVGLGMLAGTSPSITAIPAGGFEIAFQANNGNLWTVGRGETGLAMAPSTSPSIVARAGGGFDVVFQARTGMMWRAGTVTIASLGLGMAGGTSPAAD